MSRHDLIIEPDVAARAGGSCVADAMTQVAMLRAPGAIIRALHASG